MAPRRSPALAAFVESFVLAAAVVAAVAAVDTSSAHCARELEEAPTALMQLKAKVQRGSPLSEPPLPMGRTFLSTDPAASAKFIVEFYHGELVELPVCAGVERAAVRMPALFSEATGWRPVIIFIQDDSLPIGDVDLAGIIGSMNKTITRAAMGVQNLYWFHLDSHDGWSNDLTWEGVEKEVAASVPVAGYQHKGKTDIDALVQIPQTMQTISMYIADPRNIPVVLQDDCRVDDVALVEVPVVPQYERPNPNGAWWKSTFFAANPEVAASVAIKVLGAEQIVAPYPLVAGPNCTAAAWVSLPGSGLNLHFVNAPEYQAYPGEMQSFIRQVRSLRNLTAGRLDRFMYNSLMLKVSSLEPFVERAQAAGVPFLMVRAGPEEQALFLDVPENDITIQLRSKYVGMASQAVPDWCAQNLGDLSSW